MFKSQALFLMTIFFVFCTLFTIFHGMFLTTSPLLNNSAVSPLDNTTQWFEPKGKVIMLVIDGLRYDYIFKDDEIPDEELYKQERSHLFHDLFVNSPENVVVCKAFADTPTLTVQRIPSVVTGSLAPKANVIFAFGALPIKEDSLVRQAHLAGHKPYFSGDGLWNDFFPNDLIDTTETRDFDIKNPNVDVATVEFIEHVAKTKDYKLIIGHLLAIDHAGHAHGLGDPRMQEAIQGMDKLLKDVIDLMDDNTTLMIVGDHGADFTGEHGHGTPGETNTIMIGYHKKGFQKYKQNASEVMRSINETTKLVKQEDFVPTISMLMGLPIPFSNMGQVVSDYYPVGSFAQSETCPDSSFELQLLRDNYINTLQIWKYFKENQEQNRLFKKEDLHYIKELLKEIESDYEDIQQLVQTSEQCSEVHGKATDTILKSQFFAIEVYRITRDTGSYDIFITLTGIFTLFLIATCYALIGQYIYTHGQQEKTIQLLSLKKFYFRLKSLVPLGILVLIVSTTVWYLGHKRRIYGIVGAYLSLIFWFIGSLSIFFFKEKNHTEKGSSAGKEIATSPSLQEEQSHQGIPVKSAKEDDTNVEDPEDLPTTGPTKRANKHQDQTPFFNHENQPFLPSRALFFLQNYKYAAGFVFIFAFSIYLIHIRNFLVLNLRNWKPASPYIAVMLMGYRLGTIFRGKMAFLLVLAALVCGFLKYQATEFSDEMVRPALGLIVAGDYIFGEVHYIVKGLNTNKLWGLAHFISFALVVLFNALRVTEGEGFLVDIAIPRAVWAMLLGTLILRKVFKVEPEVWKRNAQLCLVIVLFMLRRDREVLPLAILLLIMRSTTQLFQKADRKNYLFAVVMAFEAYVGLFYLEHTDTLIPFNFTVAFIGLNTFNMVLSPINFLLNYVSTLIFAFIHISHNNQYLDSKVSPTKHVELEDADKPSDDKSSFLSIGFVNIMKKRDVLLFVPYFNMVMISACIRLFVFREFHFDLVLEKFLLDSVLYTFTIGVAYFMF